MTPIPAESFEELEKLERKHAENPEGRYFVPLANAYRRAGELQRAITLIQQGLEKHPDYLSAHIVLGRCLVDQGDTAGAQGEFRYVLSLDPQNLIALRTLAELASQEGKRDEAAQWYRDLLAVDPMNEDAHRALGEMERQAGEPSGETPDSPALDPPAPAGLLDDIIVGAPDFDAVGGTASSTSTSEEENALFGTMIDLDDLPYPEPSDAVVTETIAELYTRQGFYDRAAEVYRELIRRKGGDATLEEQLRRVERLAEVRPDVADAEDSDDEGAVAGLEVESWGEIEIEPAAPTREIAPAGDLPLVDPFADSFADGFPGSDDLADLGLDDVGEGAWSSNWEEPREEETAPATADGSATAEGSATADGSSIRAYLAGVLAWRPEPRQGAAGESGAEEGTPIAEVESELAGPLPTVLEVEPDTSLPMEIETEAASPLATEPVGEIEEDTTVGSDMLAADVIDPEPASAFESPLTAESATESEPAQPSQLDESTGPTAESSDELFPWELPAARLAEPEERKAAEVFATEPSSTGSAEAEIVSSEASPVPASESPPGHEEAGSAPAAEVEDVAQALPEGGAVAESSAQAPHEEDTDDDLESFQAWLRSLKR